MYMPEIVERERSVQPSITPYRSYTGLVSWSALIAGTITFLSLQLMFTVLGIGIGAASMDAFTQGNPLSGLGIGGGIWFLVTGLIALFLAGVISSRMAGLQYKLDSLVHGFLTWCLVAVVSVYLGAVVLGGLFTGLGAGAGQAAGEAAQGAVAQTQAPEGGAPAEPGFGTEPGIPMTDRFETQREPAQTEVRQQPRGEVRQAAETAREGAAISGIGAGVGMLLGALACMLGAYAGRPKYGRLEYGGVPVR
jgi:ElaB/YqjD/DUF883 family membrane-anchored ribosome-binding protein